MRKFLFSIISVINMILLGIAYGLGSNTAMYLIKPDEHPVGNWYQLVFNACDKGYAVQNIVGFVLLVAATALVVLALIPFRCRKYVNILAGAALIVGGIFVLQSPANYLAMSGAEVIPTYHLSGSLIAMATLMFVAAGLAIIGAFAEFATKKAK